MREQVGNDRKYWGQRHTKHMEGGLTLPSLEQWYAFLKDIPRNGRVLEIGAGTGDHSFAMSRERQDITYVMMDLARKHLREGIAIHQKGASGHIFNHRILPQGSFEEFQPIRDSDHKLDGAFANNALFFADKSVLKKLLQNVALSLKDGGGLRFNYITPSQEFTQSNPFEVKVYPLDETALKNLLSESGFDIDNIKYITRAYTRLKRDLPTLFITAHKKISSKE